MSPDTRSGFSARCGICSIRRRNTGQRQSRRSAQRQRGEPTRGRRGTNCRNVSIELEFIGSRYRGHIMDDHDTTRRSGVGISRIFGHRITDAAAHCIKRIVEAVSYNDIAALFLFVVGVVIVDAYQAIIWKYAVWLFILFALLLVYFRASGTKIKMAQLRNEEIRAGLSTNTSPQLRLPAVDDPPPGSSRR